MTYHKIRKRRPASRKGHWITGGPRKASTAQRSRGVASSESLHAMIDRLTRVPNKAPGVAINEMARLQRALRRYGFDTEVRLLEYVIKQVRAKGDRALVGDSQVDRALGQVRSALLGALSRTKSAPARKSNGKATVDPLVFEALEGLRRDHRNYAQDPERVKENLYPAAVNMRVKKLRRLESELRGQRGRAKLAPYVSRVITQMEYLERILRGQAGTPRGFATLVGRRGELTQALAAAISAFERQSV